MDSNRIGGEKERCGGESRGLRLIKLDYRRLMRQGGRGSDEESVAD